MKRLFRLLILTSLFAIFGCKSALEAPHLIDPIYIDLKSEESKYENLIKKEAKSLEVSRKELLDTQPRTLDRKIKHSEVSNAEKNLQKYKQKKEFYRIKAELRRAYGKREYLEAFSAGKAWPPKEDITAYRVNKQIRQTPRKWSVRVPGSPHYDAKLAGQTIPSVQNTEK